MPRLVVLVTLLSSAVFPGPAAPALDGEGAPLVYYPTRVGAEWTYKYPEADVSFVVTKVEDKDGRKVVSVGSVGGGGKAAPHTKVEVSDKGLFQLESVVFRVNTDGGPKPENGWMVHDPRLCLLKLPSKAGDKWEIQRNLHVRVSYTAGDPEEVKCRRGSTRPSRSMSSPPTRRDVGSGSGTGTPQESGP